MVGVSKDTRETSKKFRESLALPYPLVGDPEGAIIGSYQVRWPLIGLAQRVTYLVGGDRKIRLALHREFDIEAHMTEVRRALAATA